MPGPPSFRIKAFISHLADTRFTTLSPWESPSVRGSYHLMAGQCRERQRSVPLALTQDNPERPSQLPMLSVESSIATVKFRFSLCSIFLLRTSFRNSVPSTHPNNPPIYSNLHLRGCLLRTQFKTPPTLLSHRTLATWNASSAPSLWQPGFQSRICNSWRSRGPSFDTFTLLYKEEF